MGEIWQMSVTALSACFAKRELSPVEVVERCLERIDRVNPCLNAVVTLDDDGARAAARESEARWRAGKVRGPLDGVPLLVKDNILVKDMRSTWGSRLYADFVPERDELPVARLRAAGAVILGKTNVPEFTLQGYTDNLLFGPTRNPWNIDLTPGGSSGGAVAAVAAGLAPLSLGTDGGGSIRRPASHTGLVGLKPSRGRVARCDGFPAILLDFEVIGPIARTVDDVVASMQVIAAADPRDACSLPFAGKPFTLPSTLPPQRILYIPTFGAAPVDPEIAASVAAAARNLERIGHQVSATENFDLAEAFNAAWPAVSQVGLAWLLASHAGWRDRVGPPFAAMVDAGAALPATRYFDALNAAAELRHRLGQLFQHYDLLLTPTAAALPWPAAEPHPSTIAGQPVGPRGHAIFTAFINATGCPAISLPGDPAAAGLPIGFQLVAPVGGDELLCALARQYEQAHPWADRWPPLS